MLNKTQRNRVLSTLALLTLPLTACSPASGETAQTTVERDVSTDDRTGIRVEVATLKKTRARLNLVRPGEAEASREVLVAAAMGGLVEKLHVDAGDRVKKGQRIAEVDRKVFAAQRAVAAVEYDDAERELDRVTSMGKAVASTRIDQAETRLARARAQLRLSDIQQSRTTIQAPFAGVLADVPTERGAFVPPGGGLARLLQIDPIIVSVSVSDRDVGGLSVGGRASVTTSGTPDSVEGKISFIAPASDVKTRTFRVEVEVDNPDERIRPGMIATVGFEEGSTRAGVVIPQDFLVTRRDGNGVFVVGDDGTAQWRPVQLGELIRDQVVVREGLVEGERVVVVGQRGLVEGDRLIIDRSGTCCREGRVEFGVERPATPTDAETDPEVTR